MALNANDYARQFKKLLPIGLIWPKDESTLQNKLYNGLSQEFARVDVRTYKLLDELDPRTTDELLQDWERACGLPDDCTDLQATVPERRQAVVDKCNAVGGQHNRYYIDLVRQYGYVITIEEFKASKCGQKFGKPMTASTWIWWFRVHAPQETVHVFKTGQSKLGEKFRNWGNQRLECLIRRYKPAHMNVLFSYE